MRKGERMAVVGAASFGSARKTWICLRRTREVTGAVRAEGRRALGMLGYSSPHQLTSPQRLTVMGVGKRFPSTAALRPT